MPVCFSLPCSRNTQSYCKFWKMLSSKVQMILNGRICSLDSHMEKLWSATILRLVVKAEPGCWTPASNLWMSWMQLHGKDAAAGISLVQGRQLVNCPCFPCLTAGSLVSWAFPMRIFLERSVLAVLLTDTPVRMSTLAWFSLFRSWIPALSWLGLLSLG